MMTQETVLQMLSSTIGLARFTGIIDALRTSPELTAAAHRAALAAQRQAEAAALARSAKGDAATQQGGQGGAGGAASGNEDAFPMYDGRFAAAVEHMHERVQRRIIALYTAPRGGAGDGGGAGSGNVEQFQEVIKLQVRQTCSQ